MPEEPRQTSYPRQPYSEGNYRVVPNSQEVNNRTPSVQYNPDGTVFLTFDQRYIGDYPSWRSENPDIPVRNVYAREDGKDYLYGHPSEGNSLKTGYGDGYYWNDDRKKMIEENQRIIDEQNRQRNAAQQEAQRLLRAKQSEQSQIQRQLSKDLQNPIPISTTPSYMQIPEIVRSPAWNSSQKTA